MWVASDAREQVTRLLVDWRSGNQHALDQLTPILYDELRKLARAQLSGERSAATLQPTALVHEAYLRLVAQDLPDFESRAHFFGVAAHLMRQILTDHARRKRSQKRGGGLAIVPLDDAGAIRAGESMVELDDAMNALAAFDSRKCKVIELRFFGGFSAEETAQALSISVATVGREQRLAEAWLSREMKRAAPAIACES